MELEASAYAALALTATIAFGLISLSAFTLLNGLSIKLHEKTQTTKLMRTQTVYYTGWVVFRVTTASRRFVSALQKD